MALPSADALFGGQSQAAPPRKPKADDLFGAAPARAPVAKPSADDLFGDTTAQMVAQNTPRGPVRYVDDQGTNESYANPAEASRPKADDLFGGPAADPRTARIPDPRSNPVTPFAAPDRAAPFGVGGLVARAAGAPPKPDGPGYVNPASAFWRDYTTRLGADTSAIKGAVSNDVARGQFIQAAFKRGGPQAARAAERQWDAGHRGAPSDFAALGGAADVLLSPAEGAADTLFGRPLEIATRGKVNRQVAGDVAALALPGGGEERAATEAERAAQTALRRGGATKGAARVLLDEQRGLKAAALPKAEELFPERVATARSGVTPKEFYDVQIPLREFIKYPSHSPFIASDGRILDTVGDHDGFLNDRHDGPVSYDTRRQYGLLRTHYGLSRDGNAVLDFSLVDGQTLNEKQLSTLRKLANAKLSGQIAPTKIHFEVISGDSGKVLKSTTFKPSDLDRVLGPHVGTDAPKRPAGYGQPVELETDAPGAKPLAPVKLDEKKPGPVYGAGRKAETPEQTAQRVDDALHRLKNSATADKLELQQFLRQLPEEHQDPKLQEELYHAIEQKLVDPKAEIPEHLRPAYEAMQSLYKEQTDLANEIRVRSGGKDVERYDYDQGYVHRVAKDRGHIFDAADTEGMGDRDVITGARRGGLIGNKSLAKTTGSLKGRKFAVIVDPKTGKRTFVEGDEYVPGTKVKGSFGKTFDVKQATTKEIEDNTDVRYHKNALLTTVDNVARLRRVKRNLDVLDSLVADAKSRGLAHRAEWHYQNEQGQWVRARANSPTPAGFRETAIPQLKGVYFDKHIADALEDFYGKDKGDLDGLLTKTNRLLSSSLFITPIPHALNVLGHWAVGRGWDWLNPYAYARAARYGTRAVKEVLSGGADYRSLLREGSGLMYGDIATENFHKVLLEKMANEVAADPAMTPIAKSFGLRDAGQLAKAMYDAVYKSSNRALWAANDIFMLSRQYELMDRGMSVREAIHEAERDIPNYRIPPQVMGQRWLSEALRSPNYTLFGRYKYGMFRAYAAMFRDMFRGSADERVEAAGKFAALMGLATVALPFADAALQAATGNKDARAHRFGPLSVPGAVADWTQGQRDWAGMLASVITPAPVLQASGEALTNRDEFGRHIIEPESTPLGKGVQAAEAAAGKFYPSSLALEALRPGGPAQAAGRLVGAELPPEGRDARRAKAKTYERRQARSRERKDPLERLIRGAQ